MKQFDSKNFNDEVFGRCVERILNVKKTELIKSKAIVIDQELATLFPDQTGGNYAVIPFKGKIGKNTKNYDGETTITANTSETYSQGIVVVGRCDAWVEKDFSSDITGGVKFLDNVAQQVNEYWHEVDQDTLLAILEGIFAMSGDFPASHTYDISSETGESASFNMTTLNTAIQKAAGDNKGSFALAIMHSMVATNLENLDLLNNLKYTDVNGIQRDLALYTLNGRLVVVDDSMPYNAETGKYTTYVLGVGAFKEVNCGVKVPYEMSRDPKTNGGEDTLYGRQRKAFVPYGISFTNAEMTTLSPTDEELKDGRNWEVVNNGKSDDDKKELDYKAIPIARIITKETGVIVPTF